MLKITKTKCNPPSRRIPTVKLPYIEPKERYVFANQEMSFLLGSINLDKSLYSKEDYLNESVVLENQNSSNQDIDIKP